MENFEDYDGLFDTGYHRQRLVKELRPALEALCSKGMSQEVYGVAAEAYPDTASIIDFKRVTRHPSAQQADVAMEMFDSLISFLPFVGVKEEDGVITITGVPMAVLQNHIYKEWKTNRLVSHMFITMGSRFFKFYSFFAIEVMYMLEKLRGSIPRRYHGTIESIQNGIRSNTWIADTQLTTPLEMNWSRLNELNVTMLTTQREYLEHYARHIPSTSMVGNMLFAAPGSGKTLTGYGWSLVNDFDTMIVVCPKNAVLDVWEQTINLNFKREPKYFHSLMPGQITGKEQYVICHYEYLGKLYEQIGKLKGRRVGVWLDESHNLNEVNSMRTELFNKVCVDVNAEGVVWASGTPLKAIGKETVPLFRSIDKLFTKEVEVQFVKIFGASKGFALDILNHRMGLSTYRITKAEVVQNEVTEYVQPITIPNPTPYTLPVVANEIKDFVAQRIQFYKQNMPMYEKSFLNILDRFEAVNALHQDKEWKRYRFQTSSMHRSFDQRRDKDFVVWCKQYEKNFMLPRMDNETKKEFKRVASVYKYVVLTVRGEALGRILTRRRIECYREMVRHTDFKTMIDSARKKTIIFTSNVAVVDEIANKLTKEGYKPLKVYGETNNELANIMKTFKSDPKANPIVATYNSLSTAVPVIEASTCVLFNPPFRQYIREQATSRVDRLGQDGPVIIISPILDTGNVKNLSSRSLDIQKWSKEMVDAIMGLGSDVPDGDDDEMSDAD